jgi:hypothetical protein
MMTDLRIERFLDCIKGECRSSPSGQYWHGFYEFLLSKKRGDQSVPPVPLILAASGASDASKHKRLSSQLEWALKNDCIEDAISYLENIAVEHWNTCPLEKWEQDSYWSP